jgi:hypothetical protein
VRQITQPAATLLSVARGADAVESDSVTHMWLVSRLGVGRACMATMVALPWTMIVIQARRWGIV